MSQDDTAPHRATQMERHLQTLVVLIVVALLLWVGNTVNQTQISVARLTVEMDYLKSSVRTPDAKFQNIEKRLDSIEKSLQRYHSEN